MTVADRFEGKRFNSPNDVCVHPNGMIYFTDPPYGLPQKEKDPRRESPIFGVYSVAPDGTVTVVDASLERPNGVTLSHDAKTLYVAQSQGGKAWVLSYPVDASGKATVRLQLRRCSVNSRSSALLYNQPQGSRERRAAAGCQYTPARS